MPDFSQGKVYMMKDQLTGLIYIGSTTQSIEDRLSNHRSNSGCNGRGTSKRLFESGGVVTIEVLDYCPCESLMELKDIEADHIKTFKLGCGDLCVNQNIPNRTQRELYIHDRERILNRVKNHYLINSDIICTKQRERYATNREQNIAKAREYRKCRTSVECPCGGRYKSLSRHLKTKMHQAYIPEYLY